MDANDRDDLAGRRGKAKTRRGSRQLPSSGEEAAPEDATIADASAPDVLDRAANARDTSATARDDAARQRDVRDSGLPDVEQLTSDLLLASRDRAAAALDRSEAALDRHRAEEYLKHTYRDSLTGVLQRDAGHDQLEREVERAHRTQSSLVVAFLDVVGLKHTNDEHGHAAGDEVLRSVGATLRAGLRGYDLIVRWGGDEFVCALPDSTLSDAKRRFHQVQALLAANADAELTIGLTELTAEDSLQEVVNRADHELYERRRHETGAAAGGEDDRA